MVDFLTYKQREQKTERHTHTYIKNCAFTLQYSYTYIHTLSTPSSPPFSGPNKHYHPSMSAHRLICCLSPCRVSALVRYKATQGNSSLSPKHLVLTVWEGEREGDADGEEMKREARTKEQREREAPTEKEGFMWKEVMVFFNPSGLSAEDLSIWKLSLPYD